METLNPDVGTPTPETTPADAPVTAPVAPAKPVDVPATPPVTPTAPVAPVLSAEDKLKADAEMQALVNRLIGEARKEGREKAKKDVLADIGVDDLAKVKAALDAERIRQEAEMTEAQRLQAQIDALNAEKQAAVEREQATQARMKQTLLATEIEKQARAFRFIDHFDLKSRLDSATIDIDLETGVVTGVAEQAKQIASKAKHLIEHPSSPNPAPPTPQPASAQAQSSADREDKRNRAYKVKF